MRVYVESDKIAIPTEQVFINNYYKWIYREVKRHYKYNKERIPETVQDVMVRFLSKNFIGRWFYKFLTNELVDKQQAERMLNCSLTYSSGKSISPVFGKRSENHSLWKVTDILSYAKFDFARYYYSPQNHSIDSDSVLKLIGYEPGNYTILQSLWRQKKLLPAELTEHQCHGVSCSQCEQGRVSLARRGVSLAHNWNDPSKLKHIQELRWNDSQLVPFLRNWQGRNRIFNVPEYIIRLEPNIGIQAGLLKYARLLINNEVSNCFKRMFRGVDVSTTVFNNGLSGEFSNDEVFHYGVDEFDKPEIIVRDVRSKFNIWEHASDSINIFQTSGLTQEEQTVFVETELNEMSAREYSNMHNVTPQRVHRLRNSLFKKTRAHLDNEDFSFSKVEDQIFDKFGVSLPEILSNVKFGKVVLARSDFFCTLYNEGITIEEISRIYGFDESRIRSVIFRKPASIRPQAII